MEISEKIQFIQRLVQRERLAFKRHVAIRMYQRNLFAEEIEQALISGKIIEDYSETEPLPSYLVLGYTKAKRPIHIVVGVDSEDEMVWAITAYEPKLLQWEKGFKKRRKKK